MAIATCCMDEMTWPEYGERLRSNPIVIVPTGMVEQHGPHLPLGVDFQLPRAIARLVAQEVDGLVAPPVNYGYKSMPRTGGGPHFPGSIGLDGGTLIAIVRDIIRELVRHGVGRICVLDGHVENRWFLTEGIDLAVREAGAASLRVVCMQHWDFLDDSTLAKVFPAGYAGIDMEHAAILETSLMMHFHPELVHADRVPDNAPMDAPAYDTWPPRPEWIPDSGSLISAAGASRAKGQCVAECYRVNISAALRREFGIGIEE
jgi:creatinine amidohydrolase